MESLASPFQAACDEAKIPGAALVAANSSGSLDYAAAFGFRTLDKEPKPPLELDTVLALFSSSKLVTTIAALQLVEKGLVNLDDDTASLLPELAALPILADFKDGTADLRPRRNPITLRHLLTHSSGLAYTFMSPPLLQYQESIGKPAFAPPRGVIESYSTPLVFEPGTSWTYGTGLDWAGLLVSRVSKLSLEDYFQKHIFAPLGIEDMTFWPDRNPQIQANLASLSIRDKSPEGTGKAVPFKGPSMTQAAQEELGGQGLYASVRSYSKILKSLLLDDERLLSKQTTSIMFKPQLSPESQEALQAIYRSQPTTGPCSIGHYPPDGQYDWGLGGLLTLQDVDWLKKGRLAWSGMPNLHWFVDREAGVCGMYGGQLMPAGDKQVKELMTLFESTLYRVGTQSSSL